MTKVFELATFTVRDGHEHDLLAERPAMIEALRREYPGLVSPERASDQCARQDSNPRPAA